MSAEKWDIIFVNKYMTPEMLLLGNRVRKFHFVGRTFSAVKKLYCIQAKCAPNVPQMCASEMKACLKCYQESIERDAIPPDGGRALHLQASPVCHQTNCCNGNS